LYPGAREKFLKVYNYVSFLISLIFLVMGILILSNAYSSGQFFRSNETLRISFGAILVVYGAFRGINAYFKMKNRSRDAGDI